MNCVTACQGPRAASSSCLAGTGAIVLCLRNSAALDSAQTQNGASRYTAQTHEAQMPGVGQQAPSWPNSPSQRPLLRFCAFALEVQVSWSSWGHAGGPGQMATPMMAMGASMAPPMATAPMYTMLRPYLALHTFSIYSLP